ncbi:MAG TPA: hypothetical protein PLC40_06355 [Candidatus Hydrogenedentes bacterium]|nr:hypothetical protein [Candidatus Hydrogenedentota bacterium]
MTRRNQSGGFWHELVFFWKRLARRASRKESPSILYGVSRPEHQAALGWDRDGFLPLPNGTPFEMLRLYRLLRDEIPDVSDAVWTWKRLCHAGYETHFEGPAAEAAAAAAHAFEARVHATNGGVTGLLDIFYASLFTYGAAGLEIIPGQERAGIYDVVPVVIWTVRFRHRNGRIEACQVYDGETILLPEDRFLYVGLDRDGTNPYGRSMLRSLPVAVQMQQRLLCDMAQATHNAGWNKLHVRYAAEDRQPDETQEAYEARMRANLERLRELLQGTKIDQNLVTFDNVAVSVLGGNQQNLLFYDNHKAVEEQVITGMHMMPVLMGRNYGSTETYGTAQFEVVNRQVETVNRRVGKLLERLYNLELSLCGLDARTTVRMKSNRTVDVLKEANARNQEIAGTLRLLEAGVIDLAEAKRVSERM